MAAKRCPVCGKVNPHFFTHCIECGARLPEASVQKDTFSRWLRMSVIVLVLALVVLFVIIPAARYSHAFGTDLSNRVSGDAAAQDQAIAEYPRDQTVESHGLRISIASARDGQNTYNSNKFYLVTVMMGNNRTAGNIRISGGDFELITTDGASFTPYSLGSKVMYDLSPSQDTSADLTFVIPQNLAAQKLRYTLPASSSTTNDQAVVVFDL